MRSHTLDAFHFVLVPLPYMGTSRRGKPCTRVWLLCAQCWVVAAINNCCMYCLTGTKMHERAFSVWPLFDRLQLMALYARSSFKNKRRNMSKMPETLLNMVYCWISATISGHMSQMPEKYFIWFIVEYPTTCWWYVTEFPRLLIP